MVENAKRRTLMNIVIVGCDRVGSSLAEQLYSDGNNVTVVNKVIMLARTAGMA